MQDETPISKTKRKEAMHALQELGSALVALSEDRLARLDLPEPLRGAVQEAKRLTRHEARRRQLQYIGKLMRTVDATPIQAKLDEWNGVSKEETVRLHLIEHWRDRLLERESALEELLARYPRADVQHLRNLIRNAQKERLADRPPKSGRLLFKALRETISREGESGTKESGV